MGNPLYEQFGSPKKNNFFDQIEQLKKTIKNPRQEVERLIQSGAMTSAQFNQLGQMANQLIGRKI